MRYFLMRSDPQFDTMPDILNWYDKIDKRYIKPGQSHHLPEREILPIRSNPNTVFIDVVSVPFFLVSRLVRDIIRMYEPKMIFKELILLDKVNRSCGVYHLPILKTIDCLAEGSKFTPDKSVIKHACINVQKVGDNCVFFIGGVKNTYVGARADLVESLLIRGARGIGLALMESQ